MHERLQRCPYLLLAVSLEVSRGVPRGVPTYYQACGGGTMVWDYPEALEVIRSEQAAGCVAAVLCGHAACYSKCRAPSCYPLPATPACYPGLLGRILQRRLAISDPALLSDPLDRSRLGRSGPSARLRGGCEACPKSPNSRLPSPRPRPLRRVPPRRARRAPLHLLLAAQQVRFVRGSTDLEH